MKVMDVTMDTSEDCVAMSVPKQKKLKQARLPFQMLSSPVSPNTAPKKRKLSSPSPSSCKGPKVSKVEKKENSVKPPEILEVDITSDKEDSNEVVPEVADCSDNSTKEKKTEPKSSMKPGALTRLFQKVAATPPKQPPPPPREEPSAKTNAPVVVLNRCDDKKAEAAPESGNESSNEALAQVLPMSEDEEADSKKEKTTEDITVDDSDSDTEISSSEDEKNSNDEGEDTAKNSSDNNTPRTPTQNKTAEQIAMKKRRLTPKQLEKRLESAKKREEREKQKAERQMQRNEEKMKRRKEREEQKKARKEKEEAEKEQKRKEKEQKELKKQMEIEQKQKEKERKEKAKEEEKKKRDEAKEEEKRKKEEEKLEAERKKQKEASTFVRFFVAKKHETKTPDEQKVDKTSNFMPFQVKADMRVAPLCRRSLTDDEKMIIDDCLRKPNENCQLYLREIKKNGWKIRKSGKTYPTETKEEDVVIVEEEEDEDDNNSNVVNQPAAGNEKHRAKLLLFRENRRPPYWGTWRKKSSFVKPRRPFAKDTKCFDYDVDSDEEWEEEEPGESLRGSDDEKDEENPDDNEYDVDNEFMVPHGYLSDEEAQADEEDEEEMPPELQQDKLKILEEEFEAEMKTKTAKIKPKVIGCIWQGFFNVYPENTPKHIVNFLMERQAWVGETPIALNPPAESPRESTAESASSKKQLPEEAVPELIRLVHGNLHGRPFLVKEFLTYWHKNHPGDEIQFTKAAVSRKIKEMSKRIACPDEGSMHLKTCWYVPEEYRKKYSLEDLRLPNQWNYLLTPKRKTLTEPPEIIEKNEKEVKEKIKDGEKEQKKTVPLITMFTKKMTQEEMQKQLQTKPSPNPKPSTSLNRPPKRATLISVPRGEQMPKASIITAFSKVNDDKKEQQAGGSANEPITISDDDKSPIKNAKTTDSTPVEDKSGSNNDNKNEG